MNLCDDCGQQIVYRWCGCGDIDRVDVNALPIYAPFGYDEYPIVNGEVTLPDGRVLRQLVGAFVKIPRQQDTLRVMPLDAVFVLWRGTDGGLWRLVLTQDGWKRAPARYML